MQGTVTVIFKSETGKGSGNNKTAVNTKTGKKSSSEREENASERLRNYVVAKSLRAGKELFLDELSFEVGYYYDMRDNLESKRDINNTTFLARKISNYVITSVMSYQFMGITGVAMNLGVSFAREALDYYQKHKEQSTKIAQLEAQMEYTRQKVGYSLTAGDKGENR